MHSRLSTSRILSAIRAPQLVQRRYASIARPNRRTSSALMLLCGLALGTSATLAYEMYFSSRHRDSLASPKYGSPADFIQAIQELRTVFPEEGFVSTDKDDRLAHASIGPRHMERKAHSVVVFPRSTEDVVKIVNIAKRYKMPIVPHSSGTSLEGQATAVVCYFPQ
jgi:D-lactate dehydrogenase (cytochrome)